MSHSARRRPAARIRGTLPVLALLAGAACEHSEPDWRASGHVRLATGAPLAGVAVTIFWPEMNLAVVSQVVTTDQDGRYSLSWEEGFGFHVGIAQVEHVIVTPSLEGFTFSPSSYDVHLDNVRDDLDFTAQPAPGDALPAIWLGISWSPVVSDDDPVKFHLIQVFPGGSGDGSGGGRNW